MLSLSAEFTINLHIAACCNVSCITGVNPGIDNVALQNLKKPFSSHCINAQIFAWLDLSPILKRMSEKVV